MVFKSESVHSHPLTAHALNYGYRGKLRVAPAGCLPCHRDARSEHDDETVESATVAGCRAPVGPAVSCRLIVIEREWRAYGNLGTDVRILLASLGTERSPGSDYRTFQR